MAFRATAMLRLVAVQGSVDQASTMYLVRVVLWTVALAASKRENSGECACFRVWCSRLKVVPQCIVWLRTRPPVSCRHVVHQNRVSSHCREACLDAHSLAVMARSTTEVTYVIQSVATNVN